MMRNAIFFFVAALFAAQPSFAQEYPQSEDEQRYEPWRFNSQETTAFVESGNEADQATLKVILSSSMGVSTDSLGFEFQSVPTAGDPYPPLVRRLMGRDLGRRVFLTIDGSQRFEAATATYSRGPDDSLIISFSFTPMADDDGVLQPSEPNCRVLQALQNARSISISFPLDDGTTSGADFTGRGSSRAIAALGVCR